jgi:hypothetical protein
MAQNISAGVPVRRVLVHGDLHAGPKFAELMNGDGWQFRYYPDAGLLSLAQIARELSACDIAYQIGGRLNPGKFLAAAKLLRKKRVVMHWTGSDVLDEQKRNAMDAADLWILDQVEHWAVSDWLAGEVKQLGPCCDSVPLPSPSVPDRATPLPSRFSVLLYMPVVSRKALYGLDQMLEVARELPHIPFELVGLQEGSIENPPSNLRIQERLSDLRPTFEQATVLWRPTRHDGLSWMVLEALGHGRHVLWTYAFPGCIQVSSAAEARDEIVRLHDLDKLQRLGLNDAGLRTIAEGGYAPKAVRGKIRARLAMMMQIQ